MPVDQRELWKRRVILMALVALVVGVPLTIALRGDGDDAAPEPAVEQPVLGDTEFLQELGVEIRVPEGWVQEQRDGVLSLRSADGQAIVAISAPGPAADAELIHAEAVDTLREQYRDVHEGATITDKQLGGLDARTSALTARRPDDGTELRILVATAAGENLAYLAEIFAAAPQPQQALVEAQALLNNLTLEG